MLCTLFTTQAGHFLSLSDKHRLWNHLSRTCVLAVETQLSELNLHFHTVSGHSCSTYLLSLLDIRQLL